MKIVTKFIVFTFVILFFFIVYLSIIGIETERFNSQIENKIKNIDNKIETELKKIKLVLDPFNFKINVKTLGPKLKNKNSVIELESLKTQISLKTLIKNKFSIENLEISSKSLEINNLISFIRSFQNIPELYFLEKAIKKGYLIADIKLEFDSDGKIKKNFVINGFIRDASFTILKKYNFQKLNLIFKYKKDNLLLNDILFSINNLNFLSEDIALKKEEEDFFISGKIKHKEIDIDQENLNLLINPLIPNFDFEKLIFSSKSNFSFKVSKKFEFNNFVLNSDALITKFSLANKIKLKNFFPDIKEKIYFSNHKLSIKYFEDNLYLNGKGKVLIQNKDDLFTYSVNKTKNILNFKTSLNMDDNPLKIKTFNYENKNALIKLEGSKNVKDEINIKNFSIEEKKNQIRINNLTLNQKFEVIKLGRVNLDYIDKENRENKVKLYKKKNQYVLSGSSFNANSLIDDLIFNDKKSNLFNVDTKINVNIEKIYLDNEYDLSNLNGDIFLKEKQITKANLIGNFKNDKRLEFTINTETDKKITTLFVDHAKPIVKRYKFIKGFDEGVLDFYSSKTKNISNSTLKIYDFKLKELPALTKILTLASLQGIADILSGEGIRFEDFEMNFKNEGTTMTISEIYAIGPAISILMDGYVEKNKTISLRGTLVPATTINKFIGSIPVLGKLLVGTKTGEGVFGVSFKIKGPPKNLETTVNPIKTLTPRFITRTLEKIKKN